MLITFTQEEQRHIKKIQDSYAPEREQLRLASEAAANKEERAHLLLKQQALYESLQEELEAFSDKCQRIRFERIKTGGTEAIIANAKEQAPMILEQIHRETVRTSEGLTTAALKEMRIGTRKKDTFFVNANYAAAWLKDELRLHIEALVDNKQALQELLEAIIETIEESQYTDNAEITDTEAKPLDVMRFRRSPLKDITTYGLMNDKASAQLLQDSTDIFQHDANGQLTLRWAVNQAPKKQEAVPVYMALTYEGTDSIVTREPKGHDLAVYNAVATSFYYWQRDNEQKPLYITPQEIWRTMNGKKSGDGHANPSKAQVKRICDSLDKMRFTRFYMDITEEIKAFDLHIEDERITSGRIETYLLNCSKVEFETDKGKTVQGYRLAEEPILYTYNKAKNHILYVPYEMLDTSAKTSDSENVTEFKNYLLQQIQLMKNATQEGKKGRYFQRNHVILLETLYKDTGIHPPEERTKGKDYKNETIRRREVRRFRQADRQKIEGLLDAWKAKGWIKGYTALNAKKQPIKERQQVRGYGIDI